MNKLLNKIINEVSLDNRVSNGMFNIEEDSHMEALRDYLTQKGIDEESVREFSNTVLEGKYPERQAYNAKGILVTFPTPEYKADAIKRGTHFEENPVKKMSNIFSDPAKPKPEPEVKPPVAGDKETTPTLSQPKTNLPVSQAPPQSTGDEPAPVQPQTTAAPQQTPQSTPDAEPEKEPTELPEPEPKSPVEKAADKDAIKTMLKGDDYMLERVVEFVLSSGHPMLLEDIRKKL